MSAAIWILAIVSLALAFYLDSGRLLFVMAALVIWEAVRDYRQHGI